MKRKTIAAVLGMAGVIGMATASYGQGYISFQNYASTPYYAVVYGSTAQGIAANLAGTAAGSNVSVELGYFIGTTSLASDITLIPSSLTAISSSLSQADNGVGSAISGWFIGPTVTIPNYASGPVSFEILATVTSGVGVGAYSGSLIWTEPASAIATGLSSPGEFTAMPGDVVMVAPVPEPTTLALAGLGGLASLMAFRRKKA